VRHDVDADGRPRRAGAFRWKATCCAGLPNLVRNALEACKRAGRAAVVGNARHGARGGRWPTTVGSPEADREQLFQPFFTTRSDGTGLGLALVLKFIVTQTRCARPTGQRAARSSP
jgi:hypothetical protein